MTATIAPLRPWTAEEFHAWRERCGLTSWDRVGPLLGIDRRTVYAYQRGERPVPAPVAGACEALERRAEDARRNAAE